MRARIRALVGEPVRPGVSRARVVLGSCALWLGLHLLAGCVSEGTDFDAYPFFDVDKTTPGAVQVTVPPLLATYDEGAPQRVIRGPGGGPIDPQAPPDLHRKRITLLYPLLTYESEGREHEFRLFAPIATTLNLNVAGPVGRLADPETASRPILYPRVLFGELPGIGSKGGIRAFPLLGYDREHLDPTADSDDTKRDFGLLPLFMAGDWPLRGSYAAFFPFGGVTYGFLGKDEMHWYGFPYPLYLYSREREVESRHILFPLVNWIEGGGHSGFRVFPFYAHYKRTDLLGRLAYDRRWILWPLITFEKNSANSGNVDAEGRFVATPTEQMMIFPFYGTIDGPDDHQTTVLWPFFRYQHVPSQDFWELRAPFPFFTIHHGRDPRLVAKGLNAERFRFDLWPFAGYRSRPGFARHFFLWPVERFETRDDDYVEDTKAYFLPLLMWHRHREKATNEDYQHTRLWPFFLYRRGTAGDVQLHALAPIFWDDPAGFERIYFPFFRLYEYRRSRAGGHSHRFLLGLASWRDEPKEEGTTDGYARLSLLFGLFQVRSGGTTKEESPRGGLRLFYLPEITWGGGS